MLLNTYEIFEKLSNFTKDEDVVAYLIKSFELCPILPVILDAVYNPSVKFDVESLPNYKPGIFPPGMAPCGMIGAMNQSYLFQPNHPNRPPNFSKERQKTKLIEILESMEAKEAVIFGAVLFKQLLYPNINAKIAKLAFPWILKGV